MRRRMLALLCSTAVLFCSCSGTVTLPEPEPEKRLAPPFAPLTEIIPGRRDVYIIVKDLESSYWKVVLSGAEDAGKNFDCNVYFSGSYSESDWDQQSLLLDQCIKAEADAVLVSPDDSVQLASKIAEVYSAGIPVVLVDTTANTDQYSVCFMTDNLIAGQRAAEEMIEVMHRKGHTESDPVRIGMMVNTTGSQTINERLSGFFQYWSQNAPENWQIITDIPCFEGSLDETVSHAEAFLEQHPELTGVFGSNYTTTAGLAQALDRGGRKDVGIVGFDYSDDILKLIRDPEYGASTIIQRQYDMSYNGIKNALKILDGEKVTVKYVETSVVIVNKETLPTLIVQNVLNHN